MSVSGGLRSARHRMKIEGLVIHLQRATTRRTQVEDLMRRLPVSSHVLDAVDGGTLSSRQLEDVYRPGLHAPRYPFPLRNAEVACFLSHRMAWQNIIDRGLDGALVLEDDVEIEPEPFGRALRLATEVSLGRAAYVQFGLSLPKGKVAILARDDDVCVLRPARVALGTMGQLVTRGAAARLLDATPVIDRPVDVFLQMHWLTGVHPLAVVPSGLLDRTSAIGGTTIHSPKTCTERIAREWSRFIYRQRVRRLSQLHGGMEG